MLATANNWKELEKLISKAIESSMNDELAKEVVEVMTEDGGVIDKTVYEPYTPYNLSGTDHHYHRTYQLKDPSNIDTHMVNGNTLSIRSTRSENGRDIAGILESGNGYDWGKNSGYVRDLDEEIGARPLHKETGNELQRTGRHIKAMKKGLKKRLGKSSVI